MNEILKFKEGRMIPKHQDGGGMYSASDLVEAGNRAFGLALYYDKRTGDLVQITSKDALARDGRVKGEVVRTGSEMQSRPYSVFNITGWKTIGPYLGKIAQKKPLTGKTNISVNEEVAELNKLNPASTGIKDRKTVVTKQPSKSRFVNRLGDLNLSDNEKLFFEQQGVNTNDAMAMQNFILKHAANANLGAKKGAGVADGYFGNKSLEAFQALRRSGIFTPKVDEQETPAPVVEQPVDAPDFGYRTSNHYGDGMALKGLGFNNYAGLQAYAKTSTDLFAQDLKKRFGDDVSAWDLAAVEGGLGVSGKYRGGRAGDFGDMARSMADWAGKTNAAYDAKEQASRTGTNGTVYSSPEIMRKFESIKLRPNLDKWVPKTKFDFSNMKFNNIFTGAQTLGSVPTTTPTE